MKILENIEHDKSRSWNGVSTVQFISTSYLYVDNCTLGSNLGKKNASKKEAEDIGYLDI